jgi:predicted enzyme related to lactoylglutathione lyase
MTTPAPAHSGTTPPALTLTATVLEAPDAHALAGFYRALLGWTVTMDEPDWVKLSAPGGSPSLSFQTAEVYRPPVWPPVPGTQGMQLHLDIETTDLDRSAAHAESFGATVSPHQPQPEDTRVLFDPAGHPFCLWVRTPE